MYSISAEATKKHRLFKKMGHHNTGSSTNYVSTTFVRHWNSRKLKQVHGKDSL